MLKLFPFKYIHYLQRKMLLREKSSMAVFIYNSLEYTEIHLEVWNMKITMKKQAGTVIVKS